MQLQLGFSCKLCQSRSGFLVSQQVRDSKDHSVFACKDCGHVQIFPLPTWGDNKEFYDRNSQATWVRPEISIDTIRDRLKIDTLRRADFISLLFDGQVGCSILEIGTGYGFFLEEMLNRKYNISGIEISESRRVIVKEITGKEIFGFDVCRYDDIPSHLHSSFDAIVAFQVFEHILEPRIFLENIRRLLSSEGVLILEVPNRDDIMIGLSDAYRDYYYQKAHVSYFNAKDLTALLKIAGFTKIDVRYTQRYSVENAMNWLIANGPQIAAPSFFSRPALSWLDRYYREHLLSEGTADTVTVIVRQ